MTPASLVTIKDVAARAGVSISTVSCVLRDAHNVSDPVKTRVRKIMRDMGYVPNRMARGMVGGRTFTIACAFPGWKWFEAESNRHQMEGLGENLEQMGYDLHLLRLRDDGSEVETLRNFYLSNRFDGAVLAGSWLAAITASRLSVIPVPIVLMNSPAHDLAASGVLLDEETGGYLAAQHLVDAGHTRVAILGPLLNPHYGRLRLRGFLRAAQHETRGGGEQLRVRELNTERFLCTPAETLALVRKALAAKTTAIFCLSDALAAQVYEAAVGLKVRIPQDLSVIGFDNSEISRLLRPPLTTIETPGLEIGRQTARMIVDAITSSGRTPSRVMLPARLQTRESVRKL